MACLHPGLYDLVDHHLSDAPNHVNAVPQVLDDYGLSRFITVKKPGGLRTLCWPYGFTETLSEGGVLVAGGDLSVVLHCHLSLWILLKLSYW